MADGAEEDGGELAQLLHHAVGQRLLGPQIALAAQVVSGVMEFEVEFPAGGIENLDGFPNDLRSSAVAGDDRDVVTFHIRCQPRTGGVPMLKNCRRLAIEISGFELSWRRGYAPGR